MRHLIIFYLLRETIKLNVPLNYANVTYANK